MSFDQIIAFHIYIYIFPRRTYKYIYPREIEATCVSQSNMASKSWNSPAWKQSSFRSIPAGCHKTRGTEKRHPKCALSNVERNKGFNSISYTSFLLSLASNLIWIPDLNAYFLWSTCYRPFWWWSGKSRLHGNIFLGSLKKWSSLYVAFYSFFHFVWPSIFFIEGWFFFLGHNLLCASVKMFRHRNCTDYLLSFAFVSETECFRCLRFYCQVFAFNFPIYQFQERTTSDLVASPCIASLCCRRLKFELIPRMKGASDFRVGNIPVSIWFIASDLLLSLFHN